MGEAALEYKFDGARVQVHRSGGDVRIFSRALNDITGAAPTKDARPDSGVAELVEAMATFSANNPGFNPATATQMPNDTNLQAASASSWHH